MKTIRILPPAAIALLQQAARTPIPTTDPLARVKAIEAATRKVRHMYPDHFTPEEDYYGTQQADHRRQ